MPFIFFCKNNTKLQVCFRYPVKTMKSAQKPSKLSTTLLALRHSKKNPLQIFAEDLTVGPDGLEPSTT